MMGIISIKFRSQYQERRIAALVVQRNNLFLGLWFYGWHIRANGTIQQSGIYFFHCGFYIVGNFVIDIVKGSIAHIPKIVAGRELALLGKFDEVEDSRRDQLHRTG